MSSPLPPLTQLEAVTVQIHELFQAMVRAGFSREEALQLTVAIINNHNTPR